MVCWNKAKSELEDSCVQLEPPQNRSQSITSYACGNENKREVKTLSICKVQEEELNVRTEKRVKNAEKFEYLGSTFSKGGGKKIEPTETIVK